MFNEERYNSLIKEYRELQMKDTDNQDEWDELVKQEGELRLQIYDMLANNLSFDEVKRRLMY
jgi:CRISPR/Cas system-associated endonuclease Cas1